jgi:predicted O-methyltransferase YrrM
VADQPALLSTVRAARRTLAEVGPAFTRSEGDFARVSLPEQDCDVLRDLLVGDRARVVVEIGLAYGSSALAIGEALVLLASEGSTYVVIDPYQEHFHHAGRDAITAAGLDGLCTLVAERSQIALPRLVAEGFVADAAFVDGSHTFHRVFVDLAYLSELVRPGGLIILDDCEWPSVATAARYFELNMRWQPEVSRTPTRLRAFRVPDSRMEPAFEDFTPFHVDDAPPP